MVYNDQLRVFKQTHIIVAHSQCSVPLIKDLSPGGGFLFSLLAGGEAGGEAHPSIPDAVWAKEKHDVGLSLCMMWG